MTEFDLPFLGKARVWLSTLPQIDVVNTDVVRRSVPSRPSTVGETRSACVELYFPAGARARYALLAGTFVPGPGELLTTELPICDGVGARLDWALASKVDEVRPGLPREYVGAIFKGLSSAGDILGAGVMTLGPAAHSLAGSSSDMFERAARTLLEILGADPASLFEESMSRILGGTG